MAQSENIIKFCSQFKTHIVKKGRTFLRPGDIPRGIYFLKKGYVRIYSVSSGGKELTLVIYKPGDFFPVVWTFTMKPSIYYYGALSDLEISIIPRFQFIKFTRENPEVYEEVLNGIIQRFQDSLKRMCYLTFGNVRARLASVLLIYSERFGIDKENGEIQIPIPFTHKDIADIVGVARETASLEIKKFLNEGIISRTGKFLIIKNKNKLNKEASLL